LSIKEFLVWAQQGWAAGNILVLSPVYDTILLKTTACVVGEITNSSTGSRVLDQNFNVIKKELTKLNKTVTDKTTQIKLNESIKLIKPVMKNENPKEEHLINLLQYYELLSEIKKVI
jgi:hypothetical protein